MPANPHRINEEGVYCHVYNRGIEKRAIFNDEQDYAVFLGYLQDYLTAPADPESAKKDFTVNGRVFRGIPHQPKNYLNQIELLAYRLEPNHFHLVLQQITQNSLASFLRSLCTRYSMYFNKKYQHRGSLFEGPYQSVQIKDVSRLGLLTCYLHQADGYSSYPEYLGTRETAWVKPEVVLSSLAKTGSNYQDFVEKYKLDPKEKELLKGLTFESESHRFAQPPKEERTPANPALGPWPKLPEFATIFTVFLILFGLGIRNIRASSTKDSRPLPNPEASEVLSDTDKTEETKPKTRLIIKINDGSTSVNIRQSPTVRSEKVGEAKDGETFEFVSIDSGWYEIKLADGSTGFVSANYAEIGGTN